MPSVSNAEGGGPPATDESTPVAELKQLVADFVDERDWSRFHAPKNIAMALAVEASELMEHFQWMEAEESRRVPGDAAKLAEVGEELADVIGYSLAMANQLGIDISTTMHAKMVKNAEKYPAEKFRGRVSSDK